MYCLGGARCYVQPIALYLDVWKCAACIRLCAMREWGGWLGVFVFLVAMGGCDDTLRRVFDLGGNEIALGMGPVGGIVTIWMTGYASWQLTIVTGWGIFNCVVDSGRGVEVSVSIARPPARAHLV